MDPIKKYFSECSKFGVPCMFGFKGEAIHLCNYHKGVEEKKKSLDSAMKMVKRVKDYGKETYLAPLIDKPKVKITKLKAYILIKKSKGKIFTAVFEKKNGMMRKMNCRLGVKQNLTGKGMSYDPEMREMIAVYDMNLRDYRMINLTTLRELKIDGVHYVVGNSKKKMFPYIYS
jgi:hypothetical protein